MHTFSIVNHMLLATSLKAEDQDKINVSIINFNFVCVFVIIVCQIVERIQNTESDSHQAK